MADGQGPNFWFTVITDTCKAGTTKAAPRVAIQTPTPMLQNWQLRILVAEDNLTNQKVIEYMLEPFDAEIEIVGNGRLALEAVSSSAYDMVLMDVQMPEMDGVTATRHIRKLDGPGADTPIIALTANAMTGDREAYLEGWHVGLCAKTFGPARTAAHHRPRRQRTGPDQPSSRRPHRPRRNQQRRSKPKQAPSKHWWPIWTPS